MTSIVDISYFIPNHRINVENNPQRYSLTPTEAKVFSRVYGLQEIADGKHLSLIQMLARPVIDVLDKTKISSKQIKYLIHAHTAKVITPFGHSLARELQQTLQLKEAIPLGMSITNCATTLSAIESASLLLSDLGSKDYAIVIVGELAFTPTVQVIPNTSITGDAAAAALISAHPNQLTLLAKVAHTCGEFAAGIWLSVEERRSFESSYVEHLSHAIQLALSEAGLSLDRIRWIVPHNVNLISWKNVASYLNCPLDKIYLENVPKYGHCFGADILINTKDILEKKLIQPDDFIVMATVGLGATFSAAVFQYKGRGNYYE